MFCICSFLITANGLVQGQSPCDYVVKIRKLNSVILPIFQTNNAVLLVNNWV